MKIWLGVLAIAGCHELVELEGADGISEDADSDADTDTDADSDADTDADTDSGTGTCVDEDLDGSCAAEDCDDTNDAIHPGAEEVSAWNLEVVDAANSAGESCALALDGDGVAHLHYIAGNGDGGLEPGEFRYATNAGGGWSIERLEGTISSHQPTSIAVDRGGGVHIAYLHRDDYSLRYRTRVDDSWEMEIVEISGAYGEGNSLALDGDGAAHVAYHALDGCLVDACDTHLFHATNESGAWATQQVTDSGNTNGGSIALGSDGRIHITYTVGVWQGDFEVRRAVRDGDEWSDELLTDVTRGEDTFWGGTCCTGLAIDDDGAAHVSIPGDNLRYMTDAPGDWHEEDLVEKGWDAYLNVLALGAGRSLHTVWAAYARAGNYLDGEIHWARAEEIEPGRLRWTSETIDAIERVDTDVSLVVDPSGLPHVAFVDGADDLVYAVRAPTDDGVDQDCDGDP